MAAPPALVRPRSLLAPDETSLAISARRAALPTAVVTVAVLCGGATLLNTGAIGAVVEVAFRWLPRISAFSLLNCLALSLPALGPLFVARLLRGRIRAEATKSLENGRAAAAGACLAATGAGTVTLGALFFAMGSLKTSGQIMFWVAGVPLGLALSLGVLGALLFQEVKRATEQASPELPVVYPGLVAAGLIGPAALGGLFFAGFGLSPLMAWLSPVLATRALRIAAWMAMRYACFLPMAYLVPRFVRRSFPGSRTAAVAAGIVVPGVLYACTDLVKIIQFTSGTMQLVLLASLALSLAMWVALAVSGSRAGGPIELPAKSSE